VVVSPQNDDVAQIADGERLRANDFAIDGGYLSALSALQSMRDQPLNGGESQWDERVLDPPFGFIDSVFGFYDVVIEPTALAVKVVHHPFSCRIRPIEASARYRQWRMFPCDSGLSLFVVSGAGESTGPIFFLVSGYELSENVSSDLLQLPTVHVVEILNAEITKQIEQAVRSAQSLWNSFDALLALVLPVLLLMAVFTFVLLKQPHLRRGPVVGARVPAFR
jgi:hypothetical protein